MTTHQLAWQLLAGKNVPVLLVVDDQDHLAAHPAKENYKTELYLPPKPDSGKGFGELVEKDDQRAHNAVEAIVLRA